MDHVKSDPAAPDGFFAAEAAGLRWLAEAGGAPVVAVRAVERTRIVLDRLQQAAPTREEAETFGRALARTHDAGAPAFGAGPPGGPEERGFIGPLPQDNRPTETWGRFYAEQRVLPFAEQAYAQGDLDAQGREIVERLCGRLADGEFDDEAAPARIHGDLWAGNVISTPGGWTLIDPAAHGGHRITDLAMLALFGNPQLERTFAAYAEASAQLPDGWRDLIGLHQVHPLLVHAAIFGGGYGAQAVRAATAYA